MSLVRSIVRPLKRWPSGYRIARKGLTAGRGLLPPRHVPGLPGRVHRNDLMLSSLEPSAVAHYARVGSITVELLAGALTRHGRDWSDVGAVLDFGSGFGRVTRRLITCVPPDHVTVTDIDRSAVAYCVREFGVRGVVGEPDMQRGALDRYDLIWAGSVATHLPEQAWLSWLRLMSSVLVEGGLLLFSTHGPDAVANLAGYDTGAGARRADVEAALTEHGFAFSPYRHYGEAASYGVTFHTAERVASDAAATGLQVIEHAVRGWDDHQDVYVCTPRS